MKKYTIAIEETVVEEFEVEANDAEDALCIAEEKYHKGEFVVTPGEVQSKQLAIVSPSGECSEWIEF